MTGEPLGAPRRRWPAALDDPGAVPPRCVCGETCHRYGAPGETCVGILHVTELQPDSYVHFCDHPAHDPEAA